MGGLSKKAFQYFKTINKEGLPRITVDGGALLFKGLKLTRGQEKQEQLTANTIAHCYDLMGYNAVGISSYELTAGLDFLLKLSKTTKLAWLSANLVDKSTSKPVFSPYLIAPAGKIKIAIIGLTSPSAKNMLSDTNATVLPWTEVLPQLHTKLQEQADMIIVLSSLPPVENRKIAEQFKDVHLILQAGNGGNNLPPKPLNNTLITQTDRQGKHIGIMKTTWRSSSIWGIDRAATLKKTQGVLDRRNWQISKYEKHGDPLVTLKEYPNKLQVYKRLLRQRRETENKINQLTKEIKNNQGAPEPSTFKNRFIAMETTLPDDHRVKVLVDKLNKKINAMGRARCQINQKLHQKYSGWRPCGNCHPKILKAWQNTRHARAYETLVNKNRQFNLDCVYCHITGVSKKNAAEALSIGVDLREVSCEACHGPGRMHLKDPKKFKLTTKPAAALCLTCHTDEHDGSFDYVQDIKLIHNFQ